MLEMPKSMEEALKIANKQKTVENAQWRLHREKQSGVKSTLILETEPENLGVSQCHTEMQIIGDRGAEDASVATRSGGCD